jgi:hypothetical protein
MTSEINCGSFWNFPSRSWYFHSSLSRWYMNLAAIHSFSGYVSKCYSTFQMSFPTPNQSTVMYLFSQTSSLTFWLRNLNGYSRPFAADIIFAGYLNFSTWFTKNFIVTGTKKDWIMD